MLLSEFQTVYNFDTDKESRHKYLTRFYDKEFAKYKNRNIVLLEIGVNSGGSLKLWNNYFYKKTIIGIDIEPRIKLQDVINTDIILHTADAYTKDSVNVLKKVCTNGIDIIIDDGSHKLADQIFVLDEYLKLLKPGGVLIIEDIQSDENLKLLKAGLNITHEVADFRLSTKTHDSILLAVRKSF